MASVSGRRGFISGATVVALGASHWDDVAAQATVKKGSSMKDVRYVVFHLPGPNWQAGKSLLEQPGVMAHVGHYKQLLEAGKLAMGGPHLDERGGGMMIPAAGVGQAELEAFAAEDPAVKSGLLRFEVRAWLVGMSA